MTGGQAGEGGGPANRIRRPQRGAGTASGCAGPATRAASRHAETRPLARTRWGVARAPGTARVAAARPQVSPRARPGAARICGGGEWERGEANRPCADDRVHRGCQLAEPVRTVWAAAAGRAHPRRRVRAGPFSRERAASTSSAEPALEQPLEPRPVLARARPKHELSGPGAARARRIRGGCAIATRRPCPALPQGQGSRRPPPSCGARAPRGGPFRSSSDGAATLRGLPAARRVRHTRNAGAPRATTPSPAMAS